MPLPRVVFLAALPLAAALAGCAANDAPPETASLRLVGVDGRWAATAAARDLLALAGVKPLGALALGEALAARTLADYAGLDDGAAAALNLTPPARGEAHVTRAFATREGIEAGATLTLRGHAWPMPYVATFFEMERTQPCARQEDAKLCFLPQITSDEARLRLRVEPGGRDAGFLPDLVELGPGGRPAWWNGSFVSPSGTATPFTAHAPLEGDLVPGELLGPMETGDWTITFRLEAAGRLQAAGAAGIARVREPGFLWFDDRLALVEGPRAQARAVLDNATPTLIEVRVAQILDAAPLAADVLLALEDARALSDASEPTALLAAMTPTQERAFAAVPRDGGAEVATRARALPAREPAQTTGALVLAAPAGIDLAALPPIDGAGAPTLAVATRAPVGEPHHADNRALPNATLFLATVDGAPGFALPAGGRWTNAPDALDNLTRSRTLVLASADLAFPPTAVTRLEIGSGNATRAITIVGSVAEGPRAALWASPALVAGVGQPGAPRLVLPIATDATREDVATRALDAWSRFGVVLDR